MSNYQGYVRETMQVSVLTLRRIAREYKYAAFLKCFIST